MNRRTLLVGAAAAAGAGLSWQPLRATAATSLERGLRGLHGLVDGRPDQGGGCTGPRYRDARPRARIGRARRADRAGAASRSTFFVPVTPRPMNTVLKAGKATVGTPIARTEMVIAYASKGQFAQQFADAVAGKPGAMPWWQILQQPGLRFGRTDPVADPQGRNIIFTIQLAEDVLQAAGPRAEDPRREHQHGADILGADRPGALAERRTRRGVRISRATRSVQHPVRPLPDEINLGDQAMSDNYAKTSLQLSDKTYKPEPLVYYAAAIAGSAHPDQAAASSIGSPRVRSRSSAKTITTRRPAHLPFAPDSGAESESAFP